MGLTRRHVGAPSKQSPQTAVESGECTTQGGQRARSLPLLPRVSATEARVGAAPAAAVVGPPAHQQGRNYSGFSPGPVHPLASQPKAAGDRLQRTPPTCWPSRPRAATATSAPAPRRLGPAVRRCRNPASPCSDRERCLVPVCSVPCSGSGPRSWWSRNGAACILELRFDRNHSCKGSRR